MGYRALLPALLLVLSCTAGPSPVDCVRPRIGSGGHGHVFVGACVPFGMVQPGPTSLPQEWDWTSGYHSSDSTVIGFSHTHLSGTGIGDLFDVTLMPVVGEVDYARGSEDDPSSGLWSYADRSREVAEPGYYSVPLLRYGILAEMTATERVGFHRYTFPESDEAAVVLDLENGGCWDKAVDTGIECVDSCTVRGWRHSTGWAKDQKVFFCMKFSRPFEDFYIHSVDCKPLYARASFSTHEGEEILVKVALSPVSMEGAAANMLVEVPYWDFDAVAGCARAAWNRELSGISVSDEDEESRDIFYTALYHSKIHPALFCDADGSYRGADGQVHADPGFRSYTIFSLWDSYRAQMPLLAILDPVRARDMALTMLDIHAGQGKLPVWHLWGNETDCMVGNPGVIVVGDAVMKGLLDSLETGAAYEAMKASVMLDERGQDLRKEYGFIPCDLYHEGLANDMEYAIADAAVASVAQKLGRTDDFREFDLRSQSWKFYMDGETRLARGRYHDGTWRTPFNPFDSGHRDNDYCEGNAFQYSWLMPHDFPALVDFHGSREALVEALDRLFAEDSRLDGNASPDISGLIGQYVHGNEPSHHIIYFYTMAGRPDRAADMLLQVYSEMYSTQDDGLAGNEDEGQMSAWYVMSALGFYQVEPASERFWLGLPVFRKAVLDVPGGKFEILRKGSGPYVQEVKLNGRALQRAYVRYDEIMEGGTLAFFMGGDPQACWY